MRHYLCCLFADWDSLWVSGTILWPHASPVSPPHSLTPRQNPLHLWRLWHQQRLQLPLPDQRCCSHRGRRISVWRSDGKSSPVTVVLFVAYRQSLSSCGNLTLHCGSWETRTSSRSNSDSDLWTGIYFEDCEYIILNSVFNKCLWQCWAY